MESVSVMLDINIVPCEIESVSVILDTDIFPCE